MQANVQIYYALNTAIHVRIRNMFRVNRGESITGQRERALTTIYVRKINVYLSPYGNYHIRWEIRN